MLAVMDRGGHSVTLYRRTSTGLVYWRTIHGNESTLAGAVAAARSLCLEAAGTRCGNDRQPGFFGLDTAEPPQSTRIGPGILPVCRINGALGKLKRPRSRNRSGS